MGEDLLDNLIMETRDTAKSTVGVCASFGNQDMDMRWKLMRSPKVWITATTPGISSKPAAVFRDFTRELCRYCPGVSDRSSLVWF